MTWWIVLVKEHFSFSFVVIFWPFLPSNAPIKQYYICYWWFFLSQGNQWTKYLVHSKILRPKPCLLMFALWLAFICSCPLSWLTISLLSQVVDPCFIHCHIFMQKLLFVALKQLQSTLWIVDELLFLIDCEQMCHPLWIQLSHWQMYMQKDEYTAFWYLQLLCYLMQLQFTIGRNKFVEVFFLCFLGQLPNLGDLSIQHHLCLYDRI